VADHAARGRGVTAKNEPDANLPNAADLVGAGSSEATPDAAALEAGRLLFAQECTFTAGAATSDALPPDSLPEVAFAGRSNVGKSSLLNALTGRNSLARTSHTPGRTRQLNFFDLGHRLMLVDLPGYGYAEASKTEIARWNALFKDYLRGRPSLRRTCLLIDSRHGIKETDRPLMKLFDETAVSFQIVLTKTDKIAAASLTALIEDIQAELARHVAGHPVVHTTSAHEGLGVPALRAALAALAEPPQPR
jgi:GTP-binding protein